MQNKATTLDENNDSAIDLNGAIMVVKTKSVSLALHSRVLL